MEIEKKGPTKLFEGEEEEWRVLDPREAFKVAEALADPLRQWIYQELGKGPLRQAELARLASKFFGRKITNVLMRYHLQLLERAGLVKFEIDLSGPKKAKIVHRSSELKIQVRHSLAPEAWRGDLGEELSGILSRRRVE